jgi:DNA-directed RNA polymerase I, II, and III subunit RPABC5
MIIPVRCFTCNKVIGSLWDPYKKLLKDFKNEGNTLAEKKALDTLGLKRYCCRRMLLCHVDVFEHLLNYQ